MKQDKRIIVSVIWIVVGIVLVALAFAGILDEFWNGMGSGLAVVGIIQMLRFYRLQKNEAYREKVEIELADERNLFIRDRAWAWSGYLFIMVTAVLVIIFKIVGQDMLSLAASFAVCFMLVLYWGSYMILKKKY